MITAICFGFFVILSLIHRFLSAFWEQGNLPYSFGFTLFYKIFLLSCLILFVHSFGWLIGFIVTLLVIFQIVYLLYFVPFFCVILKTYVASVKKQMEFRVQIGDTKIPFNFVAEFVLGAWSSLVPVFFILCIVSVFTDNYMNAFYFIENIGIKTFVVITFVFYLIGQMATFLVKI